MIVVFSTSSPLASIALFDDGGSLVFSGEEPSNQNGGAVCLELLKSSSVPLESIEGFVADIGPGSFTGVRVGVMLAKTLGWAKGRPVAGVTSFDLINPVGPVSLPGKRGEWLVRQPGETPGATLHFVGTGYGTGAPESNYPNASRLAGQIKSLRWIDATLLMPDYILEPSISTPKKPYLPGAVS